MATVTLETMRRIVRELCDQETAAPTTAFVEDSPELDSRINERLCDLRDLLIEYEGQEWASLTGALLLEAGVTDYDLPADFDELLGVRIAEGSDQYPLRTWDYADLAELESGAPCSSARELRYRIRGETAQVSFRPAPARAWTVHADYVPAYRELVEETSVSFAMPYGAWMHAAYAAAIDCLQKEDLDPGTLVASLGRKEAQLKRKAARRDAGAPVRIKRVRRDTATSRRYPRLWSDS